MADTPESRGPRGLADSCYYVSLRSTVGPPRCRMRLLDYMHYMEAQAAQPYTSDLEPLYLFDDAPPVELLADLRPPPQLSFDLLEEAVTLRNEHRNERRHRHRSERGDGEEEEEEEEAAGLLEERYWLVVGPAGSGCRWHQVRQAPSSTVFDCKLPRTSDSVPAL